jgi:hypothetical protein
MYVCVRVCVLSFLQRFMLGEPRWKVALVVPVSMCAGFYGA